MAIATQTQTRLPLRVEEGEIKIIVPHRDNSEITFIHLSVGPNTYFAVEQQLKERGLITPTNTDNVYLTATAWQNKDNKYAQNVLEILKTTGWLWGFTGILYAPEEGAYFRDHPQTKDNALAMEKSELVKALKAKGSFMEGDVKFNADRTIRYVPFGYAIAHQTSYDMLAENPFVIAHAGGQEQAKLLAEVASNYLYEPYVWSFENVDEEKQKPSALVADYIGDRLSVDGGRFGGGRGGLAFGVRAARSAASENAPKAHVKN